MSTEFSEDEIFAAFSKLIEDEKINWAELTDPKDLYTLCDKTSAQFGGLPDSILKTVMLTVLEENLAVVDSAWLGEHLQSLIVCWEREVASEKPFSRSTQVVMAAPSYDPLPRAQKKRGRESRKNGRMMLSVGALLQSVAQGPIKTEEKSVQAEKSAEIVEIENMTFEGNELSWDFWSKVSNPEPIPLPMTSKTTPKTLQMEHSDYKKWKKAQHEKRMGRKKLKIMDAARREMEEFDRQERVLEDEEDGAVEEKKEMEEGEIDSDEEQLSRKRKKRRERRSSISSESNSSDTESDVKGSNSRRRRSLMRKDKPRRSETAVFNNQLFSDLYVFRHRLFKDLPLKQKKSLVRHFNEAIKHPSK